MGRLIPDRDISSTLDAADQWIKSCLIGDSSILTDMPLWDAETVQAVHGAFVGNPDYSDDDFMTKLRGQMDRTSVAARRLMAEMLWILLLFPSNVKANTKRKRIQEAFGQAGQIPNMEHPFLQDDVLTQAFRCWPHSIRCKRAMPFHPTSYRASRTARPSRPMRCLSEKARRLV